MYNSEYPTMEYGGRPSRKAKIRYAIAATNTIKDI